MPSPGIRFADVRMSVADLLSGNRRLEDNNLKRKALGWPGVLQLDKSVVTDNLAKSSEICTIRPQF